MATAWAFIEAEVFSRVGALISEGSATTAETSYQTIPKVGVIDDPAFNLSAVRTAIIDTAMEVIGAICKNAGDNRRNAFKLTASVAHNGAIPSSMGPLGAIYDAATGRPLVQRSASEVAERVANPSSVFTVDVFFYAIDGTRLLHTVSSATMEYFSYDRPATTFAELEALFDSTLDVFPLGDEFAVVVADGAAGRLAQKAGSYIETASAFLQSYYTGLKERGVSVQPSDFAPQPTS